LELFKRTEYWDELCQVCYGLRWDHGLRGDVEAAVSRHRRGLDYAMLPDEVRFAHEPGHVGRGRDRSVARTREPIALARILRSGQVHHG
jgi:hypothetical protein